MFTTNMMINQRYRLENEIGRGGIGIVYSAIDTLLERKVAVKVLHTSQLGSEGRANLLREAQIIAQLDHPNIITIHDAGVVTDVPYLVMELIDGKSLDQLIPLPVEKIYTYLPQICSALAYAHAQGIVHRDLKPGNILLEHNEHIKLMDFGLARSTTSRMTVEGAISGTVFYLAPEQALGKEVDARSDLYALGITLYELLTGEVPFTGDDPIAVITQHLYAPVVPPRLKNEAIPAALNELILRLLCKEPGDRPQSAAEALAFLDRNLNGKGEAVDNFDSESILDRIVRGRMVARQPELAEVEKLWGRAKSSERQLLLISGEPGIGKTRFMREIVTRVEVSGGTALVGECYAESSTPYTPFTQIARVFVQTMPEIMNWPEHLLADLLRLAPDMRARFPPLQPNSPLEPQAEQTRLFENMVTCCQLLCEQKPLLIGVEDAHWADSGSVNLFHHLVRRTRNLPILFVLTYREVELADKLPLQGLLVDLNRERIGTNLRLKRLDKQATEVMLGTLFAEEITPEFLAAIYQATEGNPFFIEEVSKALVESGQVYYQDGRWQRPSIEKIQIPQSVRLAIQSRLGKLPEEAQEMLRYAAVIGREFTIEVLQEASRLADDQLISAIEAAEYGQFIEELNRSNGLTYQFTHALFPATLVDSIHTLRRRRIHGRIAEVIQQLHPNRYEALAYHFTEGGDDRQAYSYLIKAGQKAAAIFANAEAEEHFLAALNLVENLNEKADLLLKLAEVRNLLGKFNYARDDYLAAAEIFLEHKDVDLAAMAYRNAARAVWEKGDTSGSLELALTGIGRTTDLQIGRGLAALLSETGREFYFVGRSGEGIPYVQRAMEIAEQGNYIDVLCDSIINLSLLISWGNESIEYLQRAVRIAEENHLYPQLQRALNNLSIEYELISGELQKCCDTSKRGIEAARQRNDLAQEMSLTSRYLEIIIELGQYGEARDILKRVHHLQDSLLPGSFSQRGFQLVEGVFLQHTGRLDQARYVFEELKRSCLESQDIQMIISADFHLAEFYLQIKEYASLKHTLEEGLDYGKLLMPVFEPIMLSMFVTMLSREGQVEQAALTLDRLMGLERIPLAPNLREIPVNLAMAELAIARQDWEQAWTAYEHAVQCLHSLEMPFREASALCDWADGRKKRGEFEDLSQRRQLLQQALAIYSRLDLSYYVEQIEQRIQDELPA